MTRGGKREGAGRPKKDLKVLPVKFYIYPHEKELIKEFIKSLRKGD